MKTSGRKQPNLDVIEACAVPTIYSSEESNEWKNLRHFSALPEITGQAWERTDKLHQWIDTIAMEAALVSDGFQKFTRWVSQCARTLFEQFQFNHEVVMKPPPLDPYYVGMEAKLAVFLNHSASEECKAEGFAIIDGIGTAMTFETPPFRSLAFMMAIFEQVSPGGTEESNSVREFIRNPGTARTAREAIELIRSWKRARGTGRDGSIPDISAVEMKEGLLNIVRNVLTVNEELNFSIRTLLARPEAKHPSEGFIQEMENHHSRLKSHMC